MAKPYETQLPFPSLYDMDIHMYVCMAEREDLNKK